MPTYVYEVVKPGGEAGERFEVFQRLSDPALTAHPETGEPVRRAIVLPQVQTMSDKGRYSKSNLERLGFSRFEKRGDGHYEKTAGQGPDAISADD
ncbi:MAG: zinc ribbon domain-containing protein [Planctomycetes bacterium]|nr:zinc ribbon domain-containing protein [Planctomycetota bacterium]